jgi:hypothetical protein
VRKHFMMRYVRSKRPRPAPQRAIAALRHKSVEREISEFNRGVIALDNKKTITRRTDYLGWTVEEVAKSANGARGLGMTLDANFPSKGLAIKVVGLVITHQYHPHYYTLDADSPPATSQNGNAATRWSVNLDIEALSPLERLGVPVTILVLLAWLA